MKVVCARCGDELIAKTVDDVITVDPCGTCGYERYQDGNADGYDAGYEAGREAADDDNRSAVGV